MNAFFSTIRFDRFKFRTARELIFIQLQIYSTLRASRKRMYITWIGINYTVKFKMKAFTKVRNSKNQNREIKLRKSVGNDVRYICDRISCVTFLSNSHVFYYFSAPDTRKSQPKHVRIHSMGISHQIRQNLFPISNTVQ